MKAKTFIGNKGDLVCWLEGWIFGLFDRRDNISLAPDSEIDVMICAALPMKSGGTIGGLIVKPITKGDILINHLGFDCYGSMCQTTARVAPESDERLKKLCGGTLGWVTPGRTPVDYASNINTSLSNRAPLVPGQAYVTINDAVEHRNRICGVATLDALEPGVVARLAAPQKARARG